MYKSVFAAIVFACTLAHTYALTDPQLFSGVFNFVNSTIFYRTGLQVPLFADGPIGGITYTPAYSGATYGNMTALWGTVWGGASHPIPYNQTTPAQILAETYGYGGAYNLDVANKRVTHTPEVSTLVSTARGVVQVRSYRFAEDGNLLNLYIADPTDGFVVATLYWRRHYPLPVGAPCSLSIAVTQDSTWIAGDGRHTRYSVKVTNNGFTSAVSVNLDIKLNGVTLESTSQVSPVSDSTTQFVAQLYGTAPGSTYNAAQFQVAGSGSFDVAIVSSKC